MNAKNNSTYVAQKLYNDFTAWRALPNRIYTSSGLANLTLEQIEEQAKDIAPVVSFDVPDASGFFKQVTDSIDGIISSFENNDLVRDIDDLQQFIFDLKPSIDLFEQTLKSSKSSMPPELYNEAIEAFRQIREIESKVSNNGLSDLRLFSSIVKDQVERISQEVGGAGRKLANGIINDYINEVQSAGSDAVELLVQEINKFSPTGSIGSKLIDEAEALVSAPLELLNTAIGKFEDIALPISKSINSVLEPSLNILNEVSRLLPSNISNEIKDITQQVIGFTDTVDRGLSAITSSGRQLQPLAGRFGVNSRINAQNASIPRGLEPRNENPFFEVNGFSGGTISFYPSGYIDGFKNHPRRNTTSLKTVSDKFTKISTEFNNLRMSVLNAYRKMPGDALRNPEISNGPSLTSPTNEPLAQSILGNTRKGTVVADLVGTLQTDAQIFQPRIG